MTKIVRKTLRGPEWLFQKLSRIAKDEYKTMNGLIIQALMDWMKAQEKGAAP